MILLKSFKYTNKFKTCCRHHQFSSVTQSCPTLCNPMDWSMPGLPVHHQLPVFTQTHVHWVSDAIQPFHPLSSPFPPAFNLSQQQGLFKWVSSLLQVANGLEFQLQHQSFQWIFSNDFLLDGLVGSPCCPDSQQSSPIPQFKRISSLHQVVEVLELQLQRQSFQWVFRTDFLYWKLTRIDWLDLLAVQGTLKSLLQHHSSKASIRG